VRPHVFPKFPKHLTPSNKLSTGIVTYTQYCQHLTQALACTNVCALKEARPCSCYQLRISKEHATKDQVHTEQP